MRHRISISQFYVISQLRFSLIVLVTFAHSYSGVNGDYSLLADWNTYEFLKLLISQTLVKVAVPVFYIISGYLFFVNVKEWSGQVYRQKIMRRLRTLLIPYLLWNLLMAWKLRVFSWDVFWVFWKSAGVQIDWFGHEQLMTAPANMPLWFLRDLMIVSLLTPIIYIGIKKLGGWLLAGLTVFYLSGVCAFVPGLSAYGVFFFTLGSFLGIRKMDLVKTMLRFERPAYVLSFLLVFAMMLTYRSVAFSSVMLCFRIVGAVAVFCLAYRIFASTNGRLPAVVCDSSYFIYLAHFVFFMSFADDLIFWIMGSQDTFALSVHYLLAPLLKVAVLVAVYAVYRFSVKIVRKNLNKG